MIKEKQKAILYMLIAVFFLTLMAALVKSINGIPVFERLFFRTAFGAGFIIIFMLQKRISFKGINKSGLIFRGLTGCIADIFYFIALTKILLAETMTITNTYPFFVLLLSAVFLGEKIKRHHIIALILCFAGTLLIIRPGFSSLNLNYFYAIGASVFAAITYTILKKVRETDSAEIVVLYFSVITTLICIPFMVFGHFVLPNMIQLAQLIGLGLAGTLYQWFMSTAFKYAPAGELSIYSYTSIVFSSITGILFWGEYPALVAIVGMISIILGAFVIFKKDARANKQISEIKKEPTNINVEEE
jgi:drug/metabolite transporter (DMT)-like permease